MIQFTDIVNVIANSFFGGSTMVAGIVIMAMVLGLIMVFSKSAFTTLVMALPVTLIFTYLNILPEEITIVMILVCVLGLAYTARGMFQ